MRFERELAPGVEPVEPLEIAADAVEKVMALNISLWSAIVACMPPENTSSCVLSPVTALSKRCMPAALALACVAAPVAVDCAAWALLYASFAAS